jgi:hypothetical protein
MLVLPSRRVYRSVHTCPPGHRVSGDKGLCAEVPNVTVRRHTHTSAVACPSSVARGMVYMIRRVSVESGTGHVLLMSCMQRHRGTA